MRYFWACLECGKKFKNADAAEKAMFGEGCPKCGGTDFDQVSEDELKKLQQS